MTLARLFTLTISALITIVMNGTLNYCITTLNFDILPCTTILLSSMLIRYYYLSPIHNISPCCYTTNIHILTTTVDMLLLLKSSEVLFFFFFFSDMDVLLL